MGSVKGAGREEVRFSDAPWRVSELDRRCVVDEGGTVVADVADWRDTDDAHLIAAAPDLLAALEELGTTMPLPVSAIRAIAKARGQTNDATPTEKPHA